MDQELWTDIQNFHPYQISTKGNVRGYTGRVMKPYLDPHGYFSFKLRKDGKYTKKYLHCLLAECFLPNPMNKPLVDHINRNRLDNRIENLRWCTTTENVWNTDRHDQEMYGIYWYENRQSYLVKLKLHNKQRYVGWRKSLDDAKLIRDQAKHRLQAELDALNELPLEIGTYLCPNGVVCD